ncbi:hypothetical protein GC105_06070 [Alkalibaculum sp. M08DMB]|uniref:DNA polymerase III subunit delta n=1 Tax=Alkalibaculum sporogenes TaxID=2655001 RepID=A0A6A7K777_9FIRM|nr:DNA polymerase III subunit [Alkalibaculum sporogenes]MPW25349.1 hypothetical protein [Alkalibaculum sporogenes]
MFKNITIDEKNKDILIKAISKDRINHCYIFVGPTGTNKRESAIEFIKAILCTEEEKPCNKCISCVKINNNNHPDFIDILPTENSIKISQLREMQRKMNIKPYESNYKVFLINNSETMGIPAQNSLLKSLEEPNSRVVMILISKSSQSLLPTILSRGQILHFNPLGRIKFEEEVSNYNLNTKGIEDLYNLSQGCIAKAKYILDNPEEILKFDKFRDYIYNIIKRDYNKVFQFSKWIKDNSIPNEDVLNNMLIIFKNILYARIQVDINEGKEVSDYLTYESIHDIIQDIIDLQSSLKYNINFQLQIERLLLKIQEEK